MTEVRRGFFPFVLGDQVSVTQSGGLGFISKNNLQLTQGGGQVIGAGNSLSVSQGGSWVMGAGGTVSIDQGGAGVLAARDVRADRSFLGIVLGPEVRVEDSTVLIGSAGATLIGIVVGLLTGVVLSRLWSRD